MGAMGVADGQRESIKRSEVDAEHLTAQLRKVGVAQLQQSASSRSQQHMCAAN